MTKRPKHYDRPGYRPGPERTSRGGGSIVDQRGKEDEREQVARLFDNERREGAGRTSIKKSHRGEGRNFVD